jgi:hypothetical protein
LNRPEDRQSLWTVRKPDDEINRKTRVRGLLLVDDAGRHEARQNHAPFYAAGSPASPFNVLHLPQDRTEEGFLQFRWCRCSFELKGLRDLQ